MKATYNKSKIMRNAWYLKKANTSMSFSACLRKAWRNEKMAVMTAKIENRPMEESKVAEWHPLTNVPADFMATAEHITETNQQLHRSMKKQDLSTIMRRAWHIARATGKAFAVCLSKAWQLYRLTKRLRAGVVRFAYEKTDGTLRKATGTLHEVVSMVKGTGRPDDGRTVRYYDVEADGFRSFRAESLITIYGL